VECEPLAIAISLDLVRAGRRVVLHGDSRARRVREIEGKVGKGDVRSVAPVEALQSVLDVEDFVERLETDAGRVDGLVFAARDPLAASVTEQSWRDASASNLKIPFFLLRSLGLGMARRGAGRVVFLLRRPERAPAGPPTLAELVCACTSTMAEVVTSNLGPEIQINTILTGSECFSEYQDQLGGNAERRFQVEEVAAVARTVRTLMTEPWLGAGPMPNPRPVRECR